MSFHQRPGSIWFQPQDEDAAVPDDIDAYAAENTAIFHIARDGTGPINAAL